MAQVVALYRFPFKGFTEEVLEELTVQDDGRVLGDRAFSFRYDNAQVPRERDGMEIWSKSKGLTRMEYPSLAALRLSVNAPDERQSPDPAECAGVDPDSWIVRIDGPTGLLVEADLTPAGRGEIAAAVAAYLLASEDARGLEAPGRLPLRVLGDISRSRFHDSARGFSSLHSRESLRALETAIECPLDDRRFRSNIVIDGVAAWEELGELSRVHIGEVEFAPQEVIGRCLNTHANPDTGRRDADVLTTLTRFIGQARPTFGRFLLPTGGGGKIRLGDQVEFVV